MAFKEKSITFRVTDDEYAQLSALAKTHKKSLPDFIKSISLLFTDNKEIFGQLDNPDVKNKLENDLESMADKLQNQQKFVELLLRSIISTQLRLEGQFKKQRKEAAKELEKDFGRISLMVNSVSATKV
ncbi:MAG: hypothetical protein D8M58_07695 [Calditrichaeota bacterium]|nr:MAG: hypothetical protein DWQ03_18795 [Calditrichota bacterium]MBL1205264.1 hypothetical protein [Calditrichota bacterium]NOG45093.1 hypothetical protein [Calditrichota bacterium]